MEHVSASPDVGLREEPGEGLLSLREEILVMISLVYCFFVCYLIFLASLLVLRT